MFRAGIQISAAVAPDPQSAVSAAAPYMIGNKCFVRLQHCSTHAIVNMYDCKMRLFLPHPAVQCFVVTNHYNPGSTLYNISWCSREKEIPVGENLNSLQE